jgi:hypothetical protein
VSIELSRETEARLTDEARRLGISVNALLERLICEHQASSGTGQGPSRELPVWHLGGVGPLHRRDIYNDAG